VEYAQTPVGPALDEEGTQHRARSPRLDEDRTILLGRGLERQLGADPRKRRLELGRLALERSHPARQLRGAKATRHRVTAIFPGILGSNAQGAQLRPKGGPGLDGPLGGGQARAQGGRALALRRQDLVFLLCLGLRHHLAQGQRGDDQG
jgi:hypothetical protein